MSMMRLRRSSCHLRCSVNVPTVWLTVEHEQPSVEPEREPHFGTEVIGMHRA
jgi:hypothetical protein